MTSDSMMDLAKILQDENRKLTAELAAAKAEVESWNAQHERMNAAWAGKVERLKLDLSRHKRAIDMARTTLEYVGNWGNDPTSVAIARNCEKGLEEITRILEGKE